MRYHIHSRCEPRTPGRGFASDGSPLRRQYFRTVARWSGQTGETE